MAKLSVKIEAITKGLSAKLSSARSSFNKFGDSVKKIGIGIASFGGALGYSIFAIARMGGKLVQTQVSMEAFLGSAEKAKQVIKDLRAFANVTPFDTNKILQTGKLLTTVEKDITKIIPLVKMLGDISAGSGKDILELANTFVKMKNKGRVTYEELNQLTEANIFSMDQLADSIGIKGKKALKTFIEGGRLGFKDIVGLMKASTSEGGKFFNLMEKQSLTFLGRLSTLQGKLQDLGMDVGGPLQKSMTSITNTLIIWTDQAKQMKGPIGEMVKMLEGASLLMEELRGDGTDTQFGKNKKTLGMGALDTSADILAGGSMGIAGVEINPLAVIGRMMQSSGLGANAKTEALLQEMSDSARVTANNTSNNRL